MSPSSSTLVPLGKPSAQVAGDLVAALRAVPDPCRAGPRRHPVELVLGVLVASFGCAGFACLADAAQWAAGADRDLLLLLGAAPDPLTGAVWRPVRPRSVGWPAGVDSCALEAVVAAWTAVGVRRTSVPAGGWRWPSTVRPCAVSGPATGAHPTCWPPRPSKVPVVLAQRAIPSRTIEIPMVATLLDDVRGVPGGVKWSV